MSNKTDWSDNVQQNTLWKKGMRDQMFLGLETFRIGRTQYLVIPDEMVLAKVNDNLFIIQEKETFEAKVEQAVKEYAYEHRKENSTGSFNVPEVTSKIISKFKGVL